MGDILAPELQAERAGTLPPAAFSQYLAISGKGVYRLSKFGQLHQILASDLSVVPPPRPTLDLSKESILRVFAVTGSSGTDIGVARRNIQGGVTVQYVDPDTLKGIVEVTLPGSTPRTSFVATGSQDIYFIDPAKASILKATQAGTSRISKLAQANATGAVLLLVDESR